MTPNFVLLATSLFRLPRSVTGTLLWECTTATGLIGIPFQLDFLGERLFPMLRFRENDVQCPFPLRIRPMCGVVGRLLLC